MRNLKKRCCWGLLILLLSGMAMGQQYDESNDFSFALKLYNEGFYDVAVKQWSTFINRYPDSDRLADARYYYGDALYKVKDFENARIEFQALAVSYPGHPRAAQSWQMVGVCYQQLGKKDEAAKAFETVKLLFPSNALAPGAVLSAGELYVELDQLPKAEQLLRDFLDRYLESSEYPRGRLLYADLLLKKGELEKADLEYQKVLDITDDKGIQAEASIGRALVYQRLGLLEKAIANLQQVVGEHRGSPSAFKALKALTRLNLDRRDWQQALTILKREGKNYDVARQRELQVMQIQALIMSGDYVFADQKATDWLNNTKSADANTVAFYQAVSKLENGQTQMAIDKLKPLEKTLADDPKQQNYRAASLYGLTMASLQKQDVPAARLYLGQLQGLAGEAQYTESLYRDLIRLAFRTGELAAGVDELQRFRGLYGNSVHRDDLIYEAGKAYFDKGQYERAMIYFEQLGEEYVCSAAWDSSMAYIDFIDTYHQRRQGTGVNEIARLMGRMITGGEKSELLFDLGRIYLADLRDYREASRIFAQYIKTAKDSSALAAGHYYLSDSYLKLAQYEAFMKGDAGSWGKKAADQLRQAMSYVRYSPEPDTLTFRFLTYAVPEAKEDLNKQFKFWQLFEKNNPQSDLLPEVRLQLAGLLARKGSLEEAVAYYDRVIASNKNAMKRGDARYRKARLLMNTGQGSAGLDALKDYLLSEKKHPHLAIGYRILADSYAAANQPGVAAQFLERLLTQFDYADVAERARQDITGLLVEAGEYARAETYIEPQLKEFAGASDPVVAKYLTAPPANYYFFSGKSRYLKSDFGSARDQLLKFLYLADSNPHMNEAYFLLGKMSRQENDLESAVLHLSLADIKNDTSFFYQANDIAADILFESGEYGEAAKRYDRLIDLALNPAKKINHEAQKIRCLINSGETASVKTQASAFEKKYKKDPALSGYMAAFELDRGKAAYRAGKHDLAIKHFKTVVGKYKKTEYQDDAHLSLIRSYATLNKAEDVIKESQKFFKNHPGNDLTAEVYLTLAEIYYRNEQPPEGLTAVKNAAESAKTPSARKKALPMLIASYKNVGQWDAALQTARSYIQEFPDADDVIVQKINMGIFLSNLNRNNEAIDHLRALKYEVSSEEEPEIQYYIGEAYYNGGQYDNAINEFLKIPLLSKKTKLQWEASALYRAGQSYERLGRKADAIRMYQEIIDRPGIQVQLKNEAKKLIAALRTG